jgi:D-alanyl-D-alanine carboxypeptidase (penicillin-binding protein 5/6)
VLWDIPPAARPHARKKTKKFNLKIGPVVTAQCAIAWEPATNKNYFARHPDMPCFMGSTAKAMTLHVALWALKKGYVSLDDEVEVSAKSAKQACTCLGSYAATQGPNFNAQTYTVAGETIKFGDALRGVAMSAAQATVGIAEFVANAVKHGKKATGSSNEALSLSLEKEFVGLMNDHVAELGLQKTLFANEHGGDAPLTGLPGPPKASAREFVKLWHHASQSDPLFLEVMGLRDWDVTTAVKVPVYSFYTFHKWYGYYPHVLGDKSGGSTGCMTCLVTTSIRLGRTVIGDIMQSPADNPDKVYDGNFRDMGEMLNWSFAQIFAPDFTGTNVPGKAIDDAALDCTGKHRCLGATITPSQHLWVLAWNADAATGNATKTGTAVIGAAGKKVPPPSKKGEPLPTVEGPPVTAVDIAYLGGIVPGRGKFGSGTTFVTASQGEERIGAGADVELRVWRLGYDGKVKSLGALAKAEEGDKVAVQRLSDNRFVLGVTDGGDLHLTTWEAGGGKSGGELSKLGSHVVSDVREFAFAPSKDRPHGFVTATRRSSSSRVYAWSVEPDGSMSQYAASPSVGTLKYVSVAERGKFLYAMAGRDANGAIRVDYWHVGNHVIEADGTMGPFPGNFTETRLAGISPAPLGAVLATREDGKLRLTPMEYDARYALPGEGVTQDYYKLGQTGGGDAKSIDLARLSSTKAAGDYATLALNADGKVQLVLWRVGKKP